MKTIDFKSTFFKIKLSFLIWEIETIILFMKMFEEVDRFFSLKSPVQRHVKIASDCAWIVGEFSGWGKNAPLLRWASHVDVEPISTCIGDFRVNAVLSVRVYIFL